MPTAYLIDASPYIFRAYFSLPETIRTPDDKPANAIYGYTEFLIQVLKKANPTHLAVAFDGSLTTSFRNEIYPEYKAQRALPPEDLKKQQQTCFDVTEAMGMVALIDDSYESDDIIGTLVKRVLQDDDFKVVVVSSDKDFAQLINSRVRLWDFARDEVYDSEKVRKKFGVPPEQIVDYMALTGDSVDNIPGVAGIGPKTASKLLEEFSQLENIFNQIETIDTLSIRGAASIKRKLKDNRDMAYISKQLVQIATEMDLDIAPQELRYHGADADRMAALCDQVGFTAIRDRVPQWQGAESEK